MAQIINSLGIVVLNPESNPSALRITARTAKDNFPEASVRCVVGEKNFDLPEMQKICPVVVGGKTITSLIDAGLRDNKPKWSLLVSAGTFLRHYSLRKYEIFCKDDKDIMYPVVNRKWSWEEATLNGLLLPTKVYSEVGPMGDAAYELGFIKLLWGLNAVSKGYKLKALVGARLI